MDADDLALFERSLRAATERHTGVALDAALTDLGWAEALETDPRAAVSTLFDLQGRAHATSDALGRVVSHALGVTRDDLAVALPAMGRWEPPGRLDGRTLHVDAVALPALGATSRTLVVARHDDGTVTVVVPTESLPDRGVEGIDPSMGLRAIENAEVELAPGTEIEPLDGAAWSDTVAEAQRALAHELVGNARRMLELARRHALEREQFGQVIAAFQAVRHRLAETLVAIETAEALLDAAWLDASPWAAAMAKAGAGRQALVATRHCQQVLAGIGFTTEHDLHHHVRRVLVLDGLFGASKALTVALGRELVATRRLPPLLSL